MRRSLRVVRQFSEEIRRSSVQEFESGKSTISQLSKRYGVSCTAIYKWVHKYGNFEKESIHIVEMKSSNQAHIKSLESRIKELEQIVGQKQISLDYYRKMIELANKEYDIDIEKNSDTPQSIGSKKTKKK